ncbi:multidrug effflux MFS transporter [Mangrovicoccus algicola]|uniref:Bcr/CflA family efflux transporter n=1 Tax=Mangrovicoccus algicola TaxID=2771008 RepID=A0A8J6YUK4_9RHOB|nr:multidrug effflux MFS transporter [Mangrovicoccus algicola]MBE3638042.1 multidrug effflux MFS transporter [Mangrovicoccus algicola]
MQAVMPVRFLDRRTPPNILTLVIIAGLSAATMNIYLPSLPRMTEHFGTDYALMQASVTVYLAMNAILQLGIGPISDRFGRRPVLLGACALFCLATLGILFSPSVWVFLAFRMAQAVIVSGLVLSRAIVRDMYPAEQAASRIGYVTMGMALVPMVAPVAGGVLDSAFGWQANFWLLLVCGIAVTALIWFDLGETAPRGGGGFAAQFRDVPQLFSSRRFWGYCLSSTLASGAFFAYLGGAPFVGSVIYGLSPAQLGLFFGAPAVGYMIGNGLSGRYSVRFGLNAMIVTGSLISTTGMLVALSLFYAGQATVAVFFGSMTLVGLGNGLVMPNAMAGMLSVRPHLAGTASGVGGAILIGGGALLSALAGVVLTPESGALPLVWLMLVSVALGLCSIGYVIRRERQLNRG